MAQLLSRGSGDIWAESFSVVGAAVLFFPVPHTPVMTTKTVSGHWQATFHGRGGAISAS